MDGHEAAEVLTERNAASASGLVALANGWPAVIGLASVSGAEIQDGESVPESLYQFFAEEVFNALEPDVQDGLATLAIAPVIDRPLAATLLERNAEGVCSAALDVGILVERGPRLEIHPLAQAFLEGRWGQVRHAPDSESIERCLAHFCERGDWDAAFDLLVRHSLLPRLAPLLREALDELLETARLSTVERWCEHANRVNLDDSIFSLSRAEVSLRRGLLAAAQAHAESVASKDPAFEFRALSIAGRAAHLESRENEALGYFRRAEVSASTDALRRRARWDQVLCMIDLEMPEALEAVDRLASGVGHDDPREVVRSAGCRCTCQMRFGRPDLADAGRALEILPIVRDPILETGFLNAYTCALALNARYEDARITAELLLTTAQRYRLDFAIPWAVAIAGIAGAGLRSWSEAEAHFRAGIDASRRLSNIHAEQHCLAGFVRTLCQQARYDEALLLTAGLSQSGGLPRPVQATRAELIASRALVLAAAGRADDARGTIDLVRGQSRVTENIVLTLAVDATIALKCHDPDAISRVTELLDVAVCRGAFDLIVVAYRSVPELLPVLLHASSRPDDLTELVRRVGDDDLARRLGSTASLVDGPKALLTRREREVHELLRQGLTNREIATLLFITEATAKLHVQHIYDKLGVRSRKAIAMQAALERSAQATSAIGDTGVGVDS
jgi:DNA-binding NarL/FixJ family response regulator